MSVVTRREVSACVCSAFGSGWIGRDELAAAARKSGARLEVVTLLERLSLRVRMRSLSSLWHLMPDVPEGD
ncbi:hypothetical protein [Streptomyces sp. NPDC002851]